MSSKPMKHVKINEDLYKKLMHLKIDRNKKSIDELLQEILKEAGY